MRFLAGRSFDASDFGPGCTPVIVNRSFVTQVLGETNALGRRIRTASGTHAADGAADADGMKSLASSRISRGVTMTPRCSTR